MERIEPITFTRQPDGTVALNNAPALSDISDGMLAAIYLLYRDPDDDSVLAFTPTDRYRIGEPLPDSRGHYLHRLPEGP